MDKLIEISDLWGNEIFIKVENILGVARNENGTLVITINHEMTIDSNKQANRIAINDDEWDRIRFSLVLSKYDLRKMSE